MTRRGRTSRLARIAAVLFMAVSAVPLAARGQEGPIIFGQQETRDPFTLYNTYSYLELQYERSVDDTDGRGVSNRTTEDRFEETFTIGTNAALYHPNLVEFDLTGTFGLYQEKIHSDAFSDRGDGTILEYDLNATILRKEEAPVTLYARRVQNTVNRQFGPTLDNTFSSYGAIVDWRHKTVPTRIEIFHSEQTQSGFADAGTDFVLKQNALVWHSEHRPSEQQVWNWDYTISQVDQDTGNEFSDEYIFQDASLTHSINFGPDNRHSLGSSINYFDQGGDFGIERLRWAERLRLQHTRNFETNYQYTFNRYAFQDNEQTSHRGQVGFIHRLYKSLVTTGDAGVEYVDRNDDSTSFEQYLRLRLDYLKQVPLGSLTAAMGVGWSRVENSSQSQPIFVIDEVRTFDNGSPLVIARQNAIPGSVNITSADRTFVYLPGVDYTVEDRGSRLQIERILGTSRIVPGQTVLIDYQLAPVGENVTTTNTFSIGGRYNIERGRLKGLSPYARFSWQDQTIEPDSVSLVPNSYTDVLVGLEYRIGRFTVGAEQEWMDSTLYPFEATRFFGRYVDRLATDTTFAAGANYSIVNYPDEDNTVRFLSATASLSHQFTHELFLVGSVTFRDEQDDRFGSTRGLEEQIELRWRRRQTSVSVLFRNSNLDSDTQDTNFQYLRVGFRRDF